MARRPGVLCCDHSSWTDHRMIPRWQVLAMIGVLLVAVALVVATSPNSFTYAIITGQCNKHPVPQVCATRPPHGIGAFHFGR